MTRQAHVKRNSLTGSLSKVLAASLEGGQQGLGVGATREGPGQGRPQAGCASIGGLRQLQELHQPRAAALLQRLALALRHTAKICAENPVSEECTPPAQTSTSFCCRRVLRSLGRL